VRHAASEGAAVAKGDALVVLAPDDRHAANAVLALALVGTVEDVEALNAVATPSSDFSDDLKRAAATAVAAIRERAEKR
jgi:hypothetical protein